MAEILEREGYRVRFRVEVPPAEVDQTYRSVLQDYARRIRIPGFRPGRVPEKVLQARIGREALLQEVQERLIDRTYPQAIRELALLPVEVRLVESNLAELLDPPPKAFTYVAEVENYPEVRLPEWTSFSLEVPPLEVNEEMEARALEELRQRYGEWVPVDREIQEGDQVFIRTEEGREFSIEMNRALPHVREALLGRRAGEEVEVPVLSGNEVTRKLRTQIQEVKALQLPELDDEFAKVVGEESLEALRAKVRSSLEAQAARAVWQARVDKFQDLLAEHLEVEIPPSMLVREQEHLLEHLAEDLAREGKSVEAYLKELEAEGKAEEFRQELRASAERRIRRALAREALAESLGTELTPEEWQAYVSELARAYRRSPAQLEVEMGETLEQLKAQRREDKAVAEALARLGYPMVG